MSNVYVIGVCGCSCSGKTKTVNSIIEFLGNETTTIISQDSYYIPGDDFTNYDIPSSLDFERMIEDVQALKNGKQVEAPIYKFNGHRRSKKTKTLYPAKILLIEGILIFTQPSLRELMDLKVFVSVYGEIALSRRLERDVKERGRTFQEVTERYFKDVLPSCKQYVEPSEEYADIVLKNNVQGKFIGLKILLDHIQTHVNTHVHSVLE
jgi:uridine kinase